MELKYGFWQGPMTATLVNPLPIFFIHGFKEVFNLAPFRPNIFLPFILESGWLENKL
jgi:hypothetical protein